MSTAVQAESEIRRDARTPSTVRIATDGKFLRAGEERFLVKGVTYGTFAPDADGYQFPPLPQIVEDFRQMSALGINTVRTYTAPRREMLDAAAREGLRVMVGLPWSQHVAFLDDRALKRTIRAEITARVAELGDHPAVLTFALGNEIPPGVVRWHGQLRVERFLRSLYEEAKAKSPANLFTYVNFPPTEFLDLSFLDICAFNVYLHREHELRAYLARLQHIAGQKPLLLAEAGADSIREGEQGQAEITAMHIRAAFEEGACGAIAFAWTDEWWRGGNPVEDWNFGLVDRQRRLKPAAAAVAAALDNAPFSLEQQRTWPRVSVVVCAYNAADTLEDNLRSLEQLTYPDYEIILVNDGSKDRTSEIGHSFSKVRVIDTPNAGLSAARNVGLAEATGEIVAYTDADTRVDRDWLTFLVQPFLTSDVVGSGGPNVVPADDAPVAQCIARAPGGPTHVLLDDRIAEHVPGCNMAFRRDALLAISGFNPIYLRAGDDVDVCWRLQARGWKIGFASSALVWHHHRSSVQAYWRQQVGYGEGETWLMAHHPEKFLDGRMLWRGRIYSPLPFVRSLWGTRINAGVWGTAAFPSVYRTDVHPFAFLPHSIRWQVFSTILTHRRARRRRRPGRTAGRRILLLGMRHRRPRRDGREEHRLREALGRRLAARQQAVVPGDGRLSPFHPAAGADSRTDPRRPVAADAGGAARRAADQPRAAAVAGRGGARAAADLGQRHRGSVLERDLDHGGSRARPAHRVAAALARRALDRDRRRLVRRSRRQRLRRPLGVARRPHAGRGARRRQVAGPDQHAPASDDLRHRRGAGHRRRADRRRDLRRGDSRQRADRDAAELADRRDAGVGADRRSDHRRAVADRASDRDRPPRHRAGHARHRHGGACRRARCGRR